ncbi:hypothetical protein [Streptomyces sp. NPDC004658]|uniref:hypothetical protein n=1 Tax=Streptomyces sp. NPDC004658 TaxID=3154672 RepID=UPI0033B79B50
MTMALRIAAFICTGPDGIRPSSAVASDNRAPADTGKRREAAVAGTCSARSAAFSEIRAGWSLA